MFLQACKVFSFPYWHPVSALLLNSFPCRICSSLDAQLFCPTQQGWAPTCFQPGAKSLISRCRSCLPQNQGKRSVELAVRDHRAVESKVYLCPQHSHFLDLPRALSQCPGMFHLSFSSVESKISWSKEIRMSAGRKVFQIQMLEAGSRNWQGRLRAKIPKAVILKSKPVGPEPI